MGLKIKKSFMVNLKKDDFKNKYIDEIIDEFKNNREIVSAGVIKETQKAYLLEFTKYMDEMHGYQVGVPKSCVEQVIGDDDKDVNNEL